MGGKKGAGENSRKVAGNAKKADVAAQKAAVEEAKKASAESEEWGKGAKSNTKKDAADAKRAEAARKKAEKEALMAEEEKALKPAKTGSSKQATKKSRGTLDLAALDGDEEASSSKSTALAATGIDNALDALALTENPNADKVDRHPERRYKAAYAIFEARRLPEVEQENKGLRRQQRIDLVRKEFEKHPDNPFNQANARFDATKEEIAGIKKGERQKVEDRLGSP